MDGNTAISRINRLIVSKLGTINMSKDPRTVLCKLDTDSMSAFRKIEKIILVVYDQYFNQFAETINAKKVPLNGIFGGSSKAIIGTYAFGDEIADGDRQVCCNVICMESINSTIVTISFDIV